MPDPDASRKNLEGYIPARLGDGATVTIAVRIPEEMVHALDEARGTATRSEYLRASLAHALAGTCTRT